jgi:hypothetical protein
MRARLALQTSPQTVGEVSGFESNLNPGDSDCLGRRSFRYFQGQQWSVAWGSAISATE